MQCLLLYLCSGTVTHLHAPAHAYADDAAAGEEGAGTAATGAGGAMQMLLSLSTAAPGVHVAVRHTGLCAHAARLVLDIVSGFLLLILVHPTAGRPSTSTRTRCAGLHRRACWARDGRFCVPSRRDDCLLLLDFSASEAAGCYALREDAEEPGFPGGSLPSLGGSSSLGGSGGFISASEQRQRSQAEAALVPSAAQVQLSQAAICAAAHPSLDVVVAGSLASCMSVVALA